MLVDMNLKEFNDTLGSDAPAPGGGSVAALSGSLGAELVSMVCNLSFGRDDLADYQDELIAAQKKEAELAAELTERVDLDTEAFNQVMAAFKMPKGTDEEKSARSAAIQDGYKAAITSPLSTAKACVEVMRVAKPLQGKINTNAMSDFGVGALMAYAGLEGAVMNVRINLPSIKDAVYVSQTEDEASALLSEGAALRDEIYAYTYANLA